VSTRTNHTRISGRARQLTFGAGDNSDGAHEPLNSTESTALRLKTLFTQVQASPPPYEPHHCLRGRPISPSNSDNTIIYGEMVPSEWRSIGKHSLYIKSSFTASSYEMWATDLCRLWHESLNRRHIIRRANEVKLQVDLDDPNNLRTVLNHLSASLDSGEVDAAKPREGQDFEVDATIHLPKPLPDGAWVFRPAICSSEEFREQVTLPLFTRIRRSEDQVTDLMQRIKDKDHIIERLLANMDKANVDLASVFPALAPHANARKGISKTEAEMVVPALKVFDPTTWREDVTHGRYYRGALHADVPDGSALDNQDGITHQVYLNLPSP
jgi:hypothetical protein